MNVRVLAATNKNLEEEMKTGNFRPDLFYRLNVLSLALPPLRERREDIPLLAEYFLQKYGPSLETRAQGFAPPALEKLQAHDWSGNVRELENVVERAILLATDERIQSEDIHLGKGRFLEGEVQRSSPAPTLSDVAGRAWYANGVLALLTTALARYEGTKSSSALRNCIAKNRIALAEYFGAERRQQLVYLTPENGVAFFDHNTRDFQGLMHKVTYGPFNAVVREPFKIYTLTALLAEEETYTAAHDVQRVLREYGFLLDDYPTAAAIVPLLGQGRIPIIYRSNHTTLLAVPKRAAHHFVPYAHISEADRQARIASFEAKIYRHHHEIFLAWKSGISPELPQRPVLVEKVGGSQ